MILAKLVASNNKNIDTYIDLSNSKVIATAVKGTTDELMIRVNIICDSSD